MNGMGKYRNQGISRRMAGRTLPLVLALLGGAGAVFLTGCKGGGAAQPAKQPVTGVKATQTATQVQVTTAHTGNITLLQPVTGALSAQDDVIVGAKLAGKITAIYYREGDQVKQGWKVAQQDPADLQAQLDQQRANLQSAITRLSQAKVTLLNAQTTLDLTRKQTGSAVAEAKAALDAAQQQLAVVKNGARAQERQQAQGNVSQAVADRETSKADLVSAQADSERAQADLRRYQKLYAQNAVSAQQMEQAKAVADSAQAHVAAAEARVNSADAHVKNQQQALSLVQEGSRTEDVQRAQASVEQARQQYITAQANLGQVNLRRADVDTAQQGILSAQAGVQQAQAAVRLAEQGLADASIYSPITGVVAERKIEPGMQVGAGKDVMRIVALNSIYFDAQLPEALYTKVTVGKSVQVDISAFPGRKFTGIVGKVFPVASSAARSFTVRVRLINEGNVLRPQMFARGEVTLETHRNTILVPRDAVLDNTGATGRVFLVKSKTGDNTDSSTNPVAREVKVKVGYANLNEVEITQGVKPGDQVVTQGQAQLENDVPVQILKTGSTTSATP